MQRCWGVDSDSGKRFDILPSNCWVVFRPLDVARGTLTVQTGPVAAAVQLLLTVGARIAGGAAAGVAPTHGLHTGASVEAGTVRTGHGDDLAVFTVESLRAAA